MTDGPANGLRLPQRVPWAALAFAFAVLLQVIGLVLWGKNEHDQRILLEQRFETYVAAVDKQRTSLIEIVNQKNRDQDAIVVRNSDEVRSLSQRLDRSELPIARRVDDIETLLRALNDKQNVINTQVDARVQNAVDHANRIDDRVDRVVQALDQTYNLLRETREQVSKLMDGTKK
jgi:methyl-accepting chemotaxis protein